MNRTPAPHESISPVHVLALVRGVIEEANDPHADRYRYFKSLFGIPLHEAAAIRCGLLEPEDRDPRVTAAGLDLYDRHLRYLPDMAANYWPGHSNPHITEAIAEVEHLYDQAEDTHTW
ncbi:hypothetical protein ACH4PU_32790 [Streptomyces sp. NPDC021100]|uniref:hypothetical protein n=1 Tax=Streptomyces sp. NPDC021100 TaxID=3365114 RepID=UPI003790EC29